MTGAEFMQPVFHFLDNAIWDYGDYLYMGLVYASLPLIGWILSGGLRRKASRQAIRTSRSACDRSFAPRAICDATVNAAGTTVSNLKMSAMS